MVAEEEGGVEFMRWVVVLDCVALRRSVLNQSINRSEVPDHGVVALCLTGAL